MVQDIVRHTFEERMVALIAVQWDVSYIGPKSKMHVYITVDYLSKRAVRSVYRVLKICTC